MAKVLRENALSYGLDEIIVTSGAKSDPGFVREGVVVCRQRRDATLERINAMPGLSCVAPPDVFCHCCSRAPTGCR